MIQSEVDSEKAREQSRPSQLQENALMASAHMDRFDLFRRLPLLVTTLEGSIEGSSLELQFKNY